MPPAQMRKILKQIQERSRHFRRFGYDLPASRRLFLKLAMPTLTGKILEVGTGKGHLAVEMARRGFRLTSIDADPAALAFAKAHLNALKLGSFVNLRKMDAGKMAFRSRAFDAVVSMDFFHHADAPAACLKEIMRVTRRALAIADLNKKGRRVMERIHRCEGRHHAVSKLASGALKKQLSKNGFFVKVYRKQYHTCLVAERRGEIP